MMNTENETSSDSEARFTKMPRYNPTSLYFRFYKNPRKNIKKLVKKLKKKAKFNGWGMKTLHEVPWHDGIDNETFLKSTNDVKALEFADYAGFYAKNIDQLQWRHWLISFAIRYVIEFTEKRELNLVECGVAYGVSAFFALRELQHKKEIGQLDLFCMHLYDAWVPSKKYGNMSAHLTQRNLSEFENNILIHEGYIPESFAAQPLPPDDLVYLHIDLNSASATLAALELFWPKLCNRGIVLFDDYGHANYTNTKKVVDTFFAGRKGILMPLPTGQAIFFR